MLAAPAAAAPTQTKITLPADPTYITYPATGASGLAVTGTSNDKSSKIDLRCDGTVSLVLKANVTPNASGVFSTTIDASVMARLGGQYCVLRAVPAGSKATTDPGFAGPRLLIGDVRARDGQGRPLERRRRRLPRARAPADRARRLLVGRRCGVQGSATTSATFQTSADVFTCAARLANTIGSRSALQVDGNNAFPAAGAAIALHGARRPSADLPGLSPIALTVSTDPATGNTTVRESEIIVKCAPGGARLAGHARDLHELRRLGPAARPHDHAGPRRPARHGDRHLVEHRRRAAQARRRLRERLDQRRRVPVPVADADLDAVHHEHPRPLLADDAVHLPRQVRVGGDNDPTHAQGAVITQLAPEAMAFRSGSSLWVKEVRTVPATGSLQVGFAYVWATTTAELQASTAAVLPTLTLPCVVPRVLGMTVPQAKDALRMASCQIGATSIQVSGKVKKYRVKAQGPRAGLTVPNATKVNVVISSGPRAKAKPARRRSPTPSSRRAAP